ncbi:hypothetical protein ACFOW1_01455 [Parasediminibacterium paludis]|uniref:SH3 domain-containing protein n=2 Tax=Parasediminibacterium paludis TaxID=908966 RepID=A0ABV8PRP0_9BACT
MKILLLSFVLLIATLMGFSQDIASFVGSYKSGNDGGLYVKICRTNIGDYFLEIASKKIYRTPIYCGFLFNDKGKVFCIINTVTASEFLSNSSYYSKKPNGFDGLRHGELKIELSLKGKNLVLDPWSGAGCRFCYSYTNVSKQNMPAATFEPKPDDIVGPTIVSIKKNGYFKSMPDDRYKTFNRYSIGEKAYVFDMCGNYLLVSIRNKKKIKKYGWINIADIKYENQ